MSELWRDVFAMPSSSSTGGGGGQDAARALRRARARGSASAYGAIGRFDGCGDAVRLLDGVAENVPLARFGGNDPMLASLVACTEWTSGADALVARAHSTQTFGLLAYVAPACAAV